jgi:hypothetical protein
MAKSKIRGFRQASVKETRELSKLPWVRDEALSDRMFEARILPDGRVLLFVADGEKAALYPSRESLEKLVKEANAEAAKGPFDPAKELLPPLDDFLRDVEAHALALGKVLRIPDDVLDRTVESIDLVDKAIARMRTAKRMTPEVFTPLVAYVGEVMRLVCDGRWGKLPSTKKKQRAVYEPAEWAAYLAAQAPILQAARAAAEQAYSDAKARHASEHRACMEREAARDEASQAIAGLPAPKPLRYEEYEQHVDAAADEPVIWAHDQGLVQPVPAIVKTLVERSTYGSLRSAVQGRVMRYVIAKREAAASGGAGATPV